tara:strand:- start:918 stop:1091 length:174 start_codon:yes stop_codon:yes gene_type:complete
MKLYIPVPDNPVIMQNYPHLLDKISCRLEENSELECVGSRTVKERNEKGFENAIIIE